MQIDDFILRHQAHWHASWQALARCAPAPDLLAALTRRYQEPHRHYHTLQHLDACLRHLSGLHALAQRPHEVALALWFHDAIYDIGASDNEQRSADWAQAAVLECGGEQDAAERVHAAIMVTRHDQAPDTADQQILLDVDLAILGATAAVFDGYEQQIGREYQAVAPAAFRANRRRILQGFLDRPRIYHTAFFRETREAQARANLGRSIAVLGMAPSPCQATRSTDD
jgi:predicted metal-dependent HD superfamily phosphohydrolase